MADAFFNIPVGNGFDFRVRGFRDSRVNPLGGTYLNAATTHTWELRTAADGGGTQVATGSLTYVAGSNGEYVGGPDGTTDGSQTMVVGTVYWVTIVLVQGSVPFSANFAVEAVRRTGSNQYT